MAEIFTASRALGLMAVVLLVFVTAGVIYLSLMEANDRHRRRKPEQSSDRQKR
ncbi:hypothetical protein [Candidatus Synechococcus spongiarum]|uniref:Uncharacterized protein n=1 Tax=Candidatus Synechococcus spongiarum TaxID=431041 RepID=A0A164Z602_9SYNE|nr:hypothetical protein [Candidatus Synechococcus spongiarum]SAY39195.1 hypothetical protein FLM9_1258 [Candidatus Synechococcus spongiarum]